MKIWRHTFTVQGSRASIFPIDMLRYDACFPTDEGECYEIARSQHAGWSPEEAKREVFAVTLVHYDSSSRWEPTAGRWQSFGWKVADYVPEARGIRRERVEW